MTSRLGIEDCARFQTQTGPSQVRIVGLAFGHPISFQTQFL
jgi:hypothetical protein